jgi:predicted metal-dependent phosphoesterase TrpH
LIALIDLHTHTTASDGRCTPEELVVRARGAAVDVLSVTDHDTVSGCGTVERECLAAGIEFVPGIEITAVLDGIDVHVLGYFIDVGSEELLAFLKDQRQLRIDRIREIAARLATYGIEVDVETILKPVLEDSRRSVGRPWVARALVQAGHVADTGEAFERWLASGRPAFVPRIAAPPEQVFARIHDAGGIASLAHPGLLGRDDSIARFASFGLDALEAYHSRHAAADTERYLRLAEQLHLAVSGGSDYHADDLHGPGGPGSVSLPRDAFDRLKAVGRRRPGATGTTSESRFGRD